MAMGPHGIRSEAHRPVVAGMHGMVCSGHPLASLAGMSVLQQGGNAVDAAIAVAAALNVVEPNMSGLGGDGFIMVYNRSTKQVRVMNATGPSPRRATREAYQSTGIPLKGARSVSVPGLLSGWIQVHQALGCQSLLADFSPAIDLAERGFPVSRKLSLGLAADPALAQFPSSRAIFTRDGVPLAAGALLVQRDLAQTFREIAETGEESFYRGRLAKAILRALAENDGLFVEDDLASYRARWQEPISVDYRGHTVYEAPPNSSGHVLLQILNLVEAFDLASLGPNNAESVHLLVEAKRLAFADREVYLADPDFADVPIDGLLSKE
ncbi:MAG TPA: gamma-glutamyltransferase, partial [Chloroflexota bacterium]|nr:gamma-glutamyltransferase [Chloroflexota bacterium]